MGKVLGDFSFAIWDASHQTLPSKNRCGSSNPASIWKTTGNCSGQAVGDRLPGGKVSFSLSGGLDSGSVCATAARIANATGNSEGLKAFTISWRPIPSQNLRSSPRSTSVWPTKFGPRLWEAIKRPFRLMRKYGQDG